MEPGPETRTASVRSPGQALVQQVPDHPARCRAFPAAVFRAPHVPLAAASSTALTRGGAACILDFTIF